MVATRSLLLALTLAALALFPACAGDSGDDVPPDDASGIVGGRVLLTLDGPLVGANVSIDHLEYQAASPVVRSHVGDTTTDDTGHFQLATGTKSGYFLITTRGGTFRDWATGETVTLDPSDELTALLYTDILEDLTTGLVTPISHLAHKLIVARTDPSLPARPDATLIDSYTLVTAHLDAHFGALHWERVAPASLDTPATSPTDPVRAAFVLAAWSMVARDIAAAAGQSVQDVNPYTLAIDLGEDLAAPPFDGNDGNAWMPSGIQFGACAAPDPSCIPGASGCTLGACRTACDAYAGTPRTALAAAVTFLINDLTRNRTGLTVADTLSFVRAVSTNTDPILFGDACVDEVDRVAPTLTWGAMPSDGAVVRGVVAFTVAAMDNVDPAPVVTWEDGLLDTDGTAAGAATTIATAAATDRDYTVRATARDAAGNAFTAQRTVTADNTAPTLTVDPGTFPGPGFFVDGATWWTTDNSPTLTGTVDDLHGPITVEARIGGVAVASATVPSGAWQVTVPAGAINPAGSVVVVRAVDAPGNVSTETPATSPLVRVDTAPPTVASIPTTFYGEAADTIVFGSHTTPTHRHATAAAVSLGAVGPCAVVSKYAYLTATAPVGFEELNGVDVRNPLRFVLRASDAGVGIDPDTFRYEVTTPGGTTLGPFTLTATPVAGSPGTYEATALLTRDGAQAIPQLGAVGAIEESTGPTGARTVYTVTLDARDRLGQPASVAPCFDYAPLGPPLQVTNTRKAVASAAVRTLEGGPYDLPSGTTSALLNDTAAAGILEVWVENKTGDPAYIDVSAPAPTAATYSKRVVTYLKPGSLVASTSPTCTLDPGGVNGHAPGGNALCYGPTPTPPVDVVVTSAPITGWVPFIGFFDVNSSNVTATSLGPCAGCAANQYQVPANTRRAIVVGARGISDLRPDVAGPYSELDGDFTGATIPGAPTVQDCEVWSPVVVDVSERCTSRRNYTQHRTLRQVGIGLPINGIEMDWLVRAAPTLTTSNQTNLINTRRLAPTYSWTTTEN